jgi:hypothetical protein
MLDKLFKYWSIGVLPVMAVFATSYILAVVPALGIFFVSLAFFIGIPTFIGYLIVTEKERKARIKERLKRKK